MAKDIILKNTDYTIEKSVNDKTTDEKKEGKNTMLYLGLGAAALIFLMLKKK